MQANISVVIPVHETDLASSRLRRLLTALARCSPSPTEILCVDDHSPAPVKSVIVESGARYLRTTAASQFPHVARRALARQLGLEAARAQRVLFLDSDILVPADLLVRIEKAMDRHGPRAMVFVRRSEVDDARMPVLQNERTDQGIGYMAYTAGGVRQPVWARQSSHCFASDREFIESVGGWDDSFVGWGEEDTELFYRLWLEGGKFVTLRRTMVGHMHHPVDHEANRASFVRNAAYFIAKHPEVAHARSAFYRRYGILPHQRKREASLSGR